MTTSTLTEAASTPLTPTNATTRPLHVAVVDEELPYPMTSGKRLRTLNLLLRLARRHRITYLCHRNSDADEARRAAAYLQEQGIETVVVDRAVPPKSGPLFYARLALNLLSPLPYSVASHTSPALRQALHEHAARNRVDVWHCEWTPYCEVLRDLPADRRVVVAHNVESLIWQRYHETEANPLKRWFIGKQWRKFEQFERRAYSTSATTVAVSPEDAQRIRREFDGRAVHVVDNGVDTAFFRPDEGLRETNRILFLGSLDWRPNLDGVALLLDRVFPAVRAAMPNARLDLVGRNPPTWLREKTANYPGVELHGSVADVRPYLTRAGVMAVPLRIGGGSRLKILEALSCAVPVTSTRIGAEGLCLEADRHLTVVEGIDEMADALIHALQHPDAMTEQAHRGRDVVLQRYDWSRLADELERVWMTIARPGRAAA